VKVSEDFGLVEEEKPTVRTPDHMHEAVIFSALHQLPARRPEVAGRGTR
jgi:hypothetical protein